MESRSNHSVRTTRENTGGLGVLSSPDALTPVLSPSLSLSVCVCVCCFSHSLAGWLAGSHSRRLLRASKVKLSAGQVPYAQHYGIAEKPLSIKGYLGAMDK